MFVVRSISVLSLAGAIASAVYGCSSTSSVADAGKDSSTVKADADAKAGPADVCDPSISGFASRTVVKARKQQACTKEQIKTLVDAGFNKNSKVNYKTWAVEDANVACVKCAVGDVSDTEWSAYLLDGQNDRGLNLAGCLELRGAAVGCPQATDDAFACLDYACTACQALVPKDAAANDPTVTAYVACRDKAGKADGACGKYTASEALNKCAVNYGVDGGVIMRPDGGEDYVKSWEECVNGLPEETDKNPSEEADYYHYAERFFGIFCGMN